MDTRLPSYVRLYETGELQQRAQEAMAWLTCCALCAQGCKVNRLEGELGVCRTGRFAVVASFGRHFGEETVLVGTHGSGTIFFANCNLSCVFCQNCDISAGGLGIEVTGDELAEMMLGLQKRGCHNINLVSPSHVVAQVLEAVAIAVEKGLRLPIVYNTGGYDALSALALLEGVVDIYMPDFKFWDPTLSLRLARAKDYPRVVRLAVYEMHRQVGDLVIDDDGIARRGLLLRHLVLPEDLSQTRRIMEFVARKISPHTYVNVMGQYYPAHQAQRYPGLDRPLRPFEHRQAVNAAREAGLYRFAD